MSAVRPRDPEVRVEPWASSLGPTAERAAEAAGREPVHDGRVASRPRAEPSATEPSHRRAWTQVGLAGSALAAPWVWAGLASRLPLPAEQQGVALLAGWLGMAVVAHTLADPRRDP